MFIYLAVFVLSSALFAYSERLGQGRWERRLCIFLAIVLPAVLAGCRGPTIGTDVLVYGIWDFRRARAAAGAVQYFASRKVALLSEPLYQMVVFTLSRVFSNYHWALFTYSLITVSFIYAGMCRFQKQMKTPLWLGMLLYYLVMYNTTLNAIRQSMAVAAVFYAVALLLEDRYKPFFLFTVVGIGFHTSAILALAFPAIYIILGQKRNQGLRRQLVHGGLFIAAICAAFLLGGFGVRWLVAHGIIRANYLSYFGGGENAISQVSIAGVLVYSGYLILVLLHYKYLNQRGLESLFFVMVSVLILLTRFGQVVSIYLPRVGYYFMPLQVVSLANITNCYSKKSQKVWIMFIVCCFLVCWFVIFAFNGKSDTVPYIFDFRP